MSNGEETLEEIVMDRDSFEKVKQMLRDRSLKVVQTKELWSKQANQTKEKTKEILTKHAVKIARQVEEHESFINKVTSLLSVLGIGAFCFILGANTRVQSRIVFFTIRWWNPETFEAMHPEGTSRRVSWPYVVQDKSYLLTWLFWVPLIAYSLWQALYFLIVNVLRRHRLLRDPEAMTSYRELSKKAQKANNIWWRLSGLLGNQNRLLMYIVLQTIFTVATTALTVPIFLSYKLHAVFQTLKGFCGSVKWRKLSVRCNAKTGDSQTEEEIGDAASTESTRPRIKLHGRYNVDKQLSRTAQVLIALCLVQIQHCITARGC